MSTLRLPHPATNKRVLLSSAQFARTALGSAPRGLHRENALNYNAYAVAELPNFAACVTPFILCANRTYVGAQSGYRPWIGCLDRIYRTMKVCGSTLVSRNFPGPFSSDWSGGWSTKVETEYRGTLRWSRLGPQNWKAPFFSSFSWDRRWRIEVANPDDYDLEELVWGAAIYEDGIEARSRHWGPRYERNSDGYSELVGFGWEDWGEWYHVAPPGGSGSDWWARPNGTSVDATPIALTWDFTAWLDLGGGSEHVCKRPAGCLVDSLSKRQGCLVWVTHTRRASLVEVTSTRQTARRVANGGA